MKFIKNLIYSDGGDLERRTAGGYMFSKNWRNLIFVMIECANYLWASFINLN